MELNGVRLHVEERGSGEPILCIHGTGSSAMAWREAVGALAALGRVIAYGGDARAANIPIPTSRTSASTPRTRRH
jgi:pimeloyl-ACP methyl ester carboxylesterase